MFSQNLTNGLKGELHWCTERATSCRGPSPQADAVGLSCTALDARDSVLANSTTQLWNILWDAVYQVADLYAKDVANKGLWIPPQQVGAGEPGEGHLQGWGVGH